VRARGALLPRGDAGGLGKWVAVQRQAKQGAAASRPCSCKLTPERAAAPEAVPGWVWTVDLEARWQENLEALRAHVGARGALHPPLGPRRGVHQAAGGA
jgi:hypothetical protein